MTLVYMALPNTLDNFMEYLITPPGLNEPKVLMKRFEDDKDALEYANKLYDSGLDVFTVVHRWHSDEEG